MAIFNYTNKYKNTVTIGGTGGTVATLTSVEFDFGTDWDQVQYDSAAGRWMNTAKEKVCAAPAQMKIKATFTITNTTSSPVTYNNLSIGYYTNGASSGHLGGINLDPITIPANNSVSVTGTITITNPKYRYPNCSEIELLTYSQNAQSHPYTNTLSSNDNFDITRYLTLTNSNTRLGYGHIKNEWAFTLPPIYDCRSFQAHYTYEPKAKAVSNTNVSPTVNLSSKLISYTTTQAGDSVPSALNGATNLTYRMPELEVRSGSDVILDSSCFDYNPKDTITTAPKAIMNNDTRTLLCNVLRDSESRSAMTFTFSTYKRNPYKKGDLALGSLVFLDNDYCYCVTSNSGSGYYDSSWYLLLASDESFTITPTGTTATISLSGSYSIEYVLQNPVRLGCFYTQYTYPSYTVNYTVDWMTKKITISSTGDGWAESPNSQTIDIALPSTTRATGSVTLVQPREYRDSDVGASSTKKTASLGVSASSNIGGSATRQSSITIYKYINLEIINKEGFRCSSTGVPSVNGDYLGLKVTWDGNEMDNYNKMTKHIKIETLINGETVYEADVPSIQSGVTWVSENSYVDDETSYKITFTISDKFRNRLTAVNIGTKVAYIEWGDEPGHIAIGKYVETNGLEIQFPVEFKKSVIFLGAGSTHMGEAAAHIPYTDTYNIGCTNVQQVLDWLNGRIS